MPMFYQVEMPDGRDDEILDYDGSEHSRTNEAEWHLRSFIVNRDKKRLQNKKAEDLKLRQDAEMLAEQRKESRIMRKQEDQILVPGSDQKS